MKGRVGSQLSMTASEMAPLPSETKRGPVDRFVHYVQAVSVLRSSMLFKRMCILSLLAWIPSIVVGYVVHLLFPTETNPDIFSNKLQFFLGAILVAPLS